MTVPVRAAALNRTWDAPEARVTARVGHRMRDSRRDKSTSRVGICCMSRSFGTLVQLNTLLQVCIKLGLTRDSRMPDLGSVQGANKKASEYGAGRDPGLFTELFTARYTAVTIASAPGYGHFGSLSRFTKPEDGGGRRGGVLGRCKFSPSFDYIISEPLKDNDYRMKYLFTPWFTRTIIL